MNQFDTYRLLQTCQKVIISGDLQFIGVIAFPIFPPPAIRATTLNRFTRVILYTAFFASITISDRLGKVSPVLIF